MTSHPRGELILAYLLHQKPYRETSVIGDFFTQTQGKIQAVCKGLRGTSQAIARKRATLQSFTPLWINLGGRSSLRSLGTFEMAGPPRQFSERNLYTALYINELLVRLLHEGDPQPDIFICYESVLSQLAIINREQGAGALVRVEALLRNFELDLLDHTGFGIDCEHDAATGMPIQAGDTLRFDPTIGFFSGQGETGRDRVRENSPAYGSAVPAEHVRAMGRRDFTSEDVRSVAKRVLRLALSAHMGNKPLYSRELYLSHIHRQK
jgi:DNA repair protein RecO (recombination protein O)